MLATDKKPRVKGASVTRVLAAGALLIASFVTFADEAPYRNPALPVEQRVQDLLGRMTLERVLRCRGFGG